MNPIAEFVKKSRKEAGLTQEEFAIRSGLGLRFVRDLEQGKNTVRMDKVNVALGMFGMEAAPARKDNKQCKHSRLPMFVYGKYSPEHLSNVLSPAYDLLPVNVIMPKDTEEVALALNGKKTHIRKKIFFFAEECDISKASAEKMIEKIVSMEPKYFI